MPRRPIRAAWRRAPMLLGVWVLSRYLAGRLTLAEAREILPDFYPEVMSLAQFNEFMAAERAAGNPSDDEEFR